MHRFSPRSGENRNRNVAISSKKAKQFEDRSVRKYQKGNSGDDKLRRCRFDLYPDLWKKRNDNVANCHRRKRNDNCGSVRKFQKGDDRLRRCHFDFLEKSEWQCPNLSSKKTTKIEMWATTGDNRIAMLPFRFTQDLEKIRMTSSQSCHQLKVNDIKIEPYATPKRQ